MTVHTILFLASNPSHTAVLHLEDEARRIRDSLRRSPRRGIFDLRVIPGARPSDLHEELEQVRPSIVHFSGHGRASAALNPGHRELVIKDDEPGGESRRGELIMCGDEIRSVRSVDVSALHDLFSAHQAAEPRVHLAVFNACHSALLLESICSVVDFVVGIDGAIGDESALVFSTILYRSLAHGRTMANAVELGRAVVKLQGHRKDAPRPVLRHGEGLDPITFRMAEPAPTVADVAKQNGISDDGRQPSLEDIERVQQLLSRLAKASDHDIESRPSCVEELVGMGEFSSLPSIARLAVDLDMHDVLAPLLRLERTMSEGRWPAGLSRVSLSIDSSSEGVGLQFCATIRGRHQRVSERVAAESGVVAVGFDASLHLERDGQKLLLSLRAGIQSPLRGQSISLRQGLRRLRRHLSVLTSGALGDDEHVILLNESILLDSTEGHDA